MKNYLLTEFISTESLVHLQEETSELEKRCIYDVMQKNKEGSAKERLSRAYAICRASLQKSGRMKKGTAEMTRKGAGISGGKSKKKDHATKVAGFEKAVKAARTHEESEQLVPLGVASKKAHDDAGNLLNLARNFHARHILGDVGPKETMPSKDQAERDRTDILSKLKDHQKHHDDLARRTMDAGDNKSSVKHLKTSVDLGRHIRNLSNPLK